MTLGTWGEAETTARKVPLPVDRHLRVVPTPPLETRVVPPVSTTDNSTPAALPSEASRVYSAPRRAWKEK